VVNGLANNGRARVVVLLGYSTAGKSTVLRHFRDAYQERLFTADTDALVAAGSSGHIYNVFFRLADGENTGPALEFIQEEENRILNELIGENEPLLIAAGPAVPIRNNWNRFLAEKRPECFYLDLSAAEVYNGLVDRDSRHRREGLHRRPNYGCWDRNSSKRFVAGEWLLMEPADAVPVITRNMAECIQAYVAAAPLESHRFRARRLANSHDDRRRLYTSIADCLGLDQSPINAVLERLRPNSLEQRLPTEGE